MRKRRPNKRSRKPPVRRASLVVSKLSAEGEGISGSVRIPFGLPGETVDVDIAGQSAAIVTRSHTSPERFPPVCQHFGRPGDACGGCTLQHLGADQARALKEERLLRSIRSVYPKAELAAIHQSPERSRRRAKFSVANGQVGFRELQRHRVIDLYECSVLDPQLFSIVEPLRILANDLRALFKTFDVQVTRTENGLDVAIMKMDEASLDLNARERLMRFADDQNIARLSVGGLPFAERHPPSLSLGGASVILPAGGFLQATRAGEAALIKEVTEAMADADTIVDLFCGLGTFALPLSQGGRSVIAADGAVEAIASLNAAARAAGRKISANVRDLFARPLRADELKDVDAAVFDPPRAGAREQAAQLAKAAIPTIVAVSCNPATLARDVGGIAAWYDLERLVLVDQFGWSAHVEAVAVLKRR